MMSKFVDVFTHWTLKKHVFFSIIFTVVMILLRMLFNNEAASVAIIGGVDGPTAVYLSGRLLPLKWVIGYGLIFLILMASYVLVKKLKKVSRIRIRS